MKFKELLIGKKLIATISGGVVLTTAVTGGIFYSVNASKEQEPNDQVAKHEELPVIQKANEIIDEPTIELITPTATPEPTTMPTTSKPITTQAPKVKEQTQPVIRDVDPTPNPTPISTPELTAVSTPEPTKARPEMEQKICNVFVETDCQIAISIARTRNLQLQAWYSWAPQGNYNGLFGADCLNPTVQSAYGVDNFNDCKLKASDPDTNIQVAFNQYQNGGWKGLRNFMNMS